MVSELARGTHRGDRLLHELKPLDRPQGGAAALYPHPLEREREARTRKQQPDARDFSVKSAEPRDDCVRRPEAGNALYSGGQSKP